MDWQPIETAPEWTGSFDDPFEYILVWGGLVESELDFGAEGDPVTVAMKVSRYKDSYAVADTIYYSARVRHPTHWMPLPQPPQ